MTMSKEGTMPSQKSVSQSADIHASRSIDGSIRELGRDRERERQRERERERERERCRERQRALPSAL